jgi:hypothetical protein
MKKIKHHIFCLISLLLPSFAMTAQVPLITTLTGEEEVPGPGDPDGSGTATILMNPQATRVCWFIVVDDIAPATAAHIHKASVNEAGPVVIALTPPTNGHSIGCIEADKDLIIDILKNPVQYYVNVHNTDFPAGALRGQLSHRPD